MSHQDDLDELCAERRLNTGEIFSANSFYGMGSILKIYAALSDRYALKGVVPHGPVLSETYVWEAERRAPLPVVFCYPEYRKRAYREATCKILISIASPFIYLLSLMSKLPRPSRSGTLFFPQHSTHHVTANMNFEQLARSLTSLDKEYQPVTVCIYWKDYNLGRHLPFLDRGMPVVSAGHMFDGNFLYRLYHLCSLHKYAAGNEIGSHMFYSVVSGCAYFHVKGFKPKFSASDSVLERDTSTVPSATRLTLQSAFSSANPETLPAQVQMAKYYLGAQNLRSPAELRRQLLHAELLDKTKFFSTGNGTSPRLFVPTFFQRALSKAKYILARTVKNRLESGRDSVRGSKNA